MRLMIGRCVGALLPSLLAACLFQLPSLPALAQEESVAVIRSSDEPFVQALLERTAVSHEMIIASLFSYPPWAFTEIFPRSLLRTR